MSTARGGRGTILVLLTKVKILFATPAFSPGIGGIEVNAGILARAFVKAGHTVSLITLTEEADGCKYPFPVLRTLNIAALCKQHMWADVVFLNHYSSRLSWPSFFFNTPVVTAIRTWLPEDNQIGKANRLLRRRILRKSRLIANSSVIADHLPHKATVIGNPYREDLFKIRPDISRVRPLLFVGRLVSDKGVDLLIRAVEKLTSDNFLKKLRLWEQGTIPLLTIVGDGPEKASLELLAIDLGVADLVEFSGARSGDEVARLMNASEVLVIPSRWREPFGNIALEGIASGCIPVASDGGGLIDAVGPCGVLFTRNDWSALAKSIEAVFSDHSLRLGLESARQSHLEKHRPENVAKRYLEVIQRAL